MRRLPTALTLVLTLLLASVSTTAAQATAFCPPGQEAHFQLGFAALKEAVGEPMGDSLECEHGNPDNLDTHQKTTTGLAVWRQTTNIMAFTNGWQTWAMTPTGLHSWTGDLEISDIANAVWGGGIDNLSVHIGPNGYGHVSWPTGEVGDWAPIFGTADIVFDTVDGPVVFGRVLASEDEDFLATNSAIRLILGPSGMATFEHAHGSITLCGPGSAPEIRDSPPCRW